MINRRLIAWSTVALFALFCAPVVGRAQSILLSSGDFALLSGSGALANAASATMVTGNVGSSTTVTGFPPGLITVNNLPATPIIGGPTLQAQVDLIQGEQRFAGNAVHGVDERRGLGGADPSSGSLYFWGGGRVGRSTGA